MAAGIPAGAIQQGVGGVADPGVEPRNLGADLFALPSSSAETAQVLKACMATATAVVPLGGGTGLAGGAVSSPGQLVLSTARLNRIISVDPVARTADVEAGVTLAQLDSALEPHGLCAGIDLGARDNATIGGMMSTNAGGIEAFRHGVMRNRVLGLEAVLADGSVMSDLSQVGKCNEGYDVKQLFIGAEGTLGIVTRAILKLVPRPIARATALAVGPSLDHGLKVHAKAGSSSLLAFELMNARYFELAVADRKLSLPLAVIPSGYAFVVECEGRSDEEAQSRLESFLEDALSAELLSDAIVAKSEAERREFWLLREDSWVVERHVPGGLWFDLTVPLSELDRYVTRIEAHLLQIDPALQAFIIGHLGDGNLHLTITGPSPMDDRKPAISECLYRGLKEIGGSFSAEHGIGLEKRLALLRYGDPGKRTAMLAIKRALDPQGILNPGKIL